MPLRKGSSKKVISRNIAELQRTKPSSRREKAIRTYMKRHNVSYQVAKRRLSAAIAYSSARKSRKKKKSKRKTKSKKMSKKKSKKKAKLGSGKRFAALKKKLAKQKGIKTPGALAASIGRKKYGKKRFQELAAKGKKRKAAKKRKKRVANRFGRKV